MLVSCLLLAFASLLASLVMQRLLKEGDRLCLVCLSPLLGSLWLILLANWVPHEQRARVLGLLIPACGALLALKGPARRERSLARPVKVCLGVGLLLVLGYTHYAQQRFLDTDNWIHEPMVASYMRGVFPPVHPFFPEIPMHGHYGRDLLVAFLTPDLADPLGTVWCLNLLFQGSAFLGLFALGDRYTGRSGESVGLAVCVFFGICVGIRTGMIDTFDGNNGVVYALLVPLFYLLGRVLEWTGRPTDHWQRGWVWLISGLSLGTYQLVYETHFGLLFLTGLSLAILLERRRAVWLGLLVVAGVALSLACVEGGPFTDIVQRKLAPHQVEERSEAAQNKGQHVTLSFPKKELFKVMVTTADYQRVSVAYSTRLFAGLRPRLSGDGYMAIFDPRFLYAHWLPLYLCPFTFWLLYRKADGVGRLGLLFWFFGSWAYLVPALVDFGALYEFEYFRWEFAAGWGWAGALGLALTSKLRGSVLPAAEKAKEGWLLKVPRDFPTRVGFALLLVAELAAGEKLLNDAWVGMPQAHMSLFPQPSSWRLAQKDLGVTGDDWEAARWLAPQVRKGDRILTNLGDETPTGLWPDSVWGTWTGALPAGRAHPPEGSRHHAHPNFYRDAISKAFNATGRVELLQAAGIRWLIIDPARLGQKARESMPTAHLRHQVGARSIYELPPLAGGVSATPAELTASCQIPGDLQELRRGRRYPVAVKLRGAGSNAVVTARVLSGVQDVVTPLALPAGESGELEHSLVTPWEEGNFLWVLEVGGKRLAEIPFHVDLEKRLSAVKARLDLPDRFEAKHFYSLRLGLTSAVAIHAGDDLFLYWRLHQAGGDYVWDLDSIPQSLPVELEAEQENIFSLQFLTPAQSGVYLPEIYLKDRATGAEIRLNLESGQIRIP